jgi:predicted nucleotidyltransferase component of viral defense system
MDQRDLSSARAVAGLIMDDFLHLSADDQRSAYEQAAAQTGLPAVSVEKDFWVCWTLRELFALPGIGLHLTFKGGTSLSKAWGLIERFSEDIDLVIDRDFLGYGGEHSPENAPSRKKQLQWLKELKAASQRRIRESVQPELSMRIAAKLPPGIAWRLEADAADPDAQTLLFDYPTVHGEAGYVAPRVKIEFGARSDTDPAETPEIGPYLATAFPELMAPHRFSVRVVAARRTFWEKAMLLHEESYRPGDKRRADRLSRHYYDLFNLIRRGVADAAMADKGLFERVATHREVFFRHSWMDYRTLQRGSLRLQPQPDAHEAWERDYAAMRDTMFFGEAPAFDDILAVVGDFERRFNAGDFPAE